MWKYHLVKAIIGSKGALPLAGQFMGISQAYTKLGKHCVRQFCDPSPCTWGTYRLVAPLCGMLCIQVRSPVSCTLVIQLQSLVEPKLNVTVSKFQISHVLPHCAGNFILIGSRRKMAKGIRNIQYIRSIHCSSLPKNYLLHENMVAIDINVEHSVTEVIVNIVHDTFIHRRRNVWQSEFLPVFKSDREMADQIPISYPHIPHTTSNMNFYHIKANATSRACIRFTTTSTIVRFQLLLFQSSPHLVRVDPYIFSREHVLMRRRKAWTRCGHLGDLSFVYARGKYATGFVKVSIYFKAINCTAINQELERCEKHEIAIGGNVTRTMVKMDTQRKPFYAVYFFTANNAYMNFSFEQLTFSGVKDAECLAGSVVLVVPETLNDSSSREHHFCGDAIFARRQYV